MKNKIVLYIKQSYSISGFKIRCRYVDYSYYGDIMAIFGRSWLVIVVFGYFLYDFENFLQWFLQNLKQVNFIKFFFFKVKYINFLFY